MDVKKNVTKADALHALAYLELVSNDNSENERFVDAVKTVIARMLHLEASLATISDWVKRIE